LIKNIDSISTIFSLKILIPVSILSSTALINNNPTSMPTLQQQILSSLSTILLSLSNSTNRDFFYSSNKDFSKDFSNSINRNSSDFTNKGSSDFINEGASNFTTKDFFNFTNVGFFNSINKDFSDLTKNDLYMTF